MKTLKYPMISVTIVFIIGILTEYCFEFFSFFILIPILILFLYALLRAKRNWNQDAFFGLMTFCLFLVLGMFSKFLHSDLNYSSHYSNFTTLKPCIIHAEVITKLKSTEKFDKYILRIHSINKNKVKGKILLSSYKDNGKSFIPNEEVILNKSINDLPVVYGPFQFDYGALLRKKNIYHQIFCSYDEVKSLGIIKKSFNYYLYLIKESVLNKLRIIKDVRLRSISEALLVGQKNDIDKDTYKDFSDAGVIHVLAISGLHVGILYLIISFFFYPVENSSFWKTPKLIIVLLGLWFFAFLTGMSASVTRAVVLFSIIAVGRWKNKEINLFNVLSISAFSILVFDSNALFDIGFQMSYLAVIMILLLKPFYKYFYFTENRIIKYLIDIVLVSFSAQLGVLPLSLYYFNQFPLLFLGANIVVIPLITILLVLGISVIISGFFSFTISCFLGIFLEFFLNIMNCYIKYIASIKWGVIKNICFSKEMTVLFYGIIFCLIYNLYFLKRKIFKRLLFLVMVSQCVYLYDLQMRKSSEMVVYGTKKTLVSLKNNKEIVFYANDKEIDSSLCVKYAARMYMDRFKKENLKNAFIFKGKKILIVDQNGIYKIKNTSDILILTGNPSINLQRLIERIQPQVVVADRTNSFFKTEKWEVFCNKNKIPFYNLYKKGFYRLR